MPVLAQLAATRLGAFCPRKQSRFVVAIITYMVTYVKAFYPLSKKLVGTGGRCHASKQLRPNGNKQGSI